MPGRIGSLRRGAPPAGVRRTGALVALAASLALAGCGTATQGGQSAVTVPGRTLSVYLGQPAGGARSEPAQDVLAAEQLAYRQSGGKVGPYTVRVRTLDGRELSANARTAVADKTAIAYLGELAPGTSDVSVEILNQQGLLEVSPLDTAAYLTQPVPGVSDSVDFFYPGHATYKRTFARVVPTSAQEAKALASEMQSEHATSLYVGDDGQRYGQTLAAEVRTAARAAGLQIATGLASASAAFYGGNAATPAARAAAAGFFTRAASANPQIHLFAPSGLYDSSFVQSLPAAAQSKLVVSSPGFTQAKLPAGGAAFVSAFTAAYHHAPAPQAVFGYEAMKALLTVLGSAGSNAANRAAVATDFRALKRTGSAIGDYSISAGDPSVAPFVFARMHGTTLTPFRFVSLG